MPKIIYVENIETNKNKVSSIDENSTNEQYPSAKAVWDCLEHAGGSIKELNSIDDIDEMGIYKVGNDLYSATYKRIKDWTPIVKGAQTSVGIKIDPESYSGDAGIFMTILDSKGNTWVIEGSQGVSTMHTYTTNPSYSATVAEYSGSAFEVLIDDTIFEDGSGNNVSMADLDISYFNVISFDGTGVIYTETWSDSELYVYKIDGRGVGMTNDLPTSEIFNDYYNNKTLGGYSTAMGRKTQAGSKAFTIISWNKKDKTFTLDSTDGLEVGMTYSAQPYGVDGTGAQGYSREENIGKITKIKGNNVTVDTLPIGIDLSKYTCRTPYVGYVTDDYDNENNIFRIAARPDLGTRNIGYGSRVSGRSTKALSKNAQAEGNKAIAQGPHSHAEGEDTEAIGISSHAQNKGAKAIGNYSSAEGRNTEATGEASHAGGTYSKAKGPHSFAGGYESEASGSCSVAFGYGSKASGVRAVVFGRSNTATNDDSFAFGNNNNATGVNSLAFGNCTTSTGMNSVSFGGGTDTNNRNEASGESSVAFGKGGNKASGIASIAFGGTTENGSMSSTQALGNSSIAFGYGCKAHKALSVAGGASSETNSVTSLAFGSYCTTNGFNGSHIALGFRLDTDSNTSQGQVVVGKWNKTSEDAIKDAAFVVGTGTSATNRQNGFIVDFNGKVIAPQYTTTLEITYENADGTTTTEKYNLIGGKEA